jgi:hypothetical protein
MTKFQIYDYYLDIIMILIYEFIPFYDFPLIYSFFRALYQSSSFLRFHRS